MKITKKQLIALDACSLVDCFEDVVGSTGWEGDWTLAHQYFLLAHPEARKGWGWLVNQRVIPAWSMSGADLRGANLCEANLYRADLRGADLYRADLRGADLRGADLVGHDLEDLKKRGAIL